MARKKVAAYDLTRGLLGADVARLQIFLNARSDAGLTVDGVYGVNTFDAVKRFQAEQGIAVDGQCAKATLKRARDLGYAAIEFDVDDNNDGPNWPRKPPSSRIKSPTLDEVQEMFGVFSFDHTPTPENPEKISIKGDWVSKNITTITIPQFVGVPIPIGSAHAVLSKGKFTCHKRAAKIFADLFTAWHEAGLTPKILTFDGAFNARLKRRTHVPVQENLSNHSWGSAFDINASQNWLGTLPAVMGARGCVREFVEIANDLGVYWGGHFGSPQTNAKRDGMHFEISRL